MDSIKGFNGIASQIDYSKPWDGKVQSSTVALNEEASKGGKSSGLQYFGDAAHTTGEYRGQGISDTNDLVNEELSKDGTTIARHQFSSTLHKGEASETASEATYHMADASGQKRDIDKATYEKMFSQLTAGKEQWFAENRVK